MRTNAMAALAASVCMVALAVPAQAQERAYNIPAGGLRSALDAFGRQSGRPIIYKVNDVQRYQSRGYRGTAAPQTVLDAILSGTGFSARIDGSGAIAIIKRGNAAVRDSDTSLGQAAEPEELAAQDEIVVTGTLIRGVAPAGTNVISKDAKSFQETGSATVTQLLQTIPQFGSFNALQSPQGTTSFGTINRPNLRGFPGANDIGTSPTLMLVDGRRMVGMGVRSNTPDADAIPPGIIQRVEIVPDGGSALYGSDAVVGVVNFITMKRFDGIKADARYGFGDEYHTFDANLTVGKEWNDGSIWASYNYAENSPIFGRDRAFMVTPESNLVGVRIKSLECPTANVLVTSSGGASRRLYAAPLPSAPDRANICDLTDDAVLYPELKRHSVYAGLNQQLNDWLETDVRSFYYHKETQELAGRFTNTSSIVSGGSPFFVNVSGDPAERQAVSYAFGPADADRRDIAIDSWGVTNSYTAQLGGSWQVRAHASYGESKSTYIQTLANTGLIGPAVASGKFNPYNPASSDPATLAAILNFENYAESRQTQFDSRVIADGDLFRLPGGAIKLAAGAEFTSETYKSAFGNVVPGNENTIARVKTTRKIWAGFGELAIPIFSDENAMPGLQALSLTASARYDHYDDVGNTFNPKFGATWKPAKWISIRGSWAKSFVAPGLSDSAAIDPTSLRYAIGPVADIIAPAPALAANGYPARAADKYVYFLFGTNPGLKPQKATTWSLGADIDPPFIPGLRLNGTYYNITYTDKLSYLPFLNSSLFWSAFAPTAVILNPTQAQINQVRSQAGIFTGTPCAPEPTCAYAIVDARKSNVGGFKQSGLDFAANYATGTGFGSMDFSIGGNYLLTQKSSPVAGAPYASELARDNSRLKMRSSLGADVGNFRAQISWNHSQGYDVLPAGLVGQTHVGDYNVFDLFFKYDAAGGGALADLSFTLNVNNVFDQDPPLYYAGNATRGRSGYANGSTVGRLVQIGVNKKF